MGGENLLRKCLLWHWLCLFIAFNSHYIIPLLPCHYWVVLLVLCRSFPLFEQRCSIFEFDSQRRLYKRKWWWWGRGASLVYSHKVSLCTGFKQTHRDIQRMLQIYENCLGLKMNDFVFSQRSLQTKQWLSKVNIYCVWLQQTCAVLSSVVQICPALSLLDTQRHAFSSADEKKRLSLSNRHQQSERLSLPEAL